MPANQTPGPLIGAGRAADVYAIGQDRVLRRYRRPFDVQAEAQVMRHLDQAGFPVPKVYDANGPDLFMERLDGQTMLADLSRMPWTAGRHARTLAALHDRLHEVVAPVGLAQEFGPGDRVLHLDLHPANVMLTSRGPVVIDWSNVRSGPPGADVAMAYLIMASSEIDQVPRMVRPAIKTVRATFIRTFRTAVQADPDPYMASVAAARMKDPNVRPSEVRYLLRVAEQAEQVG